MLSLVINPGLPDERMFPLEIGTVTIGRTKDNDVFCVHKSLSRKHAKLEFDGGKLRIFDLGSKNGVYYRGERVAECEINEGDSFRCGDITFFVEGTTARAPKQSTSGPAQTLPSPLAAEMSVSRRPRHAPAGAVQVEDQRSKDKLFVLIRASELLVGELTVERLLDELVALAVQVLEVDRIAFFTLDERSLELKPRAMKTFVGGGARPYSKRVVDWVVDRGSAASFDDVSKDRTLPGSPGVDAGVRAAMCVPINAGSGAVGVLYVDSTSRPACFRADDLALLRALANLAAVGIESDALRRNRSA